MLLTKQLFMNAQQNKHSNSGFISCTPQNGRNWKIIEDNFLTKSFHNFREYWKIIPGSHIPKKFHLTHLQSCLKAEQKLYFDLQSKVIPLLFCKESNWQIYT